MFSDSFYGCKQKTAYEMRISDWSSDVCSSDLVGLGYRCRVGIEQTLHEQAWTQQIAGSQRAEQGLEGPADFHIAALVRDHGQSGGFKTNGRASCRERVCQSV